MTKKVEPFPDRIRHLREVKGWSQNELAERADLAPTALSRILAGERDLQMGHLIALAAALGVTPSELAADTTAASVILMWVPLERFEESEKMRLEIVRERDIARADAAARTAEVESQKKSIRELHLRLEDLERQLAQSRSEIESAREQKRELTQLRERVVSLEARESRLKAEAQEFAQALEASRSEATEYRRGWEGAYEQSKQLHAALASAKGGQLGAGAIGLFLGAMLSNAPSRRRRA